MNGINSVNLTGSIVRNPKLINNGGLDVLLGTVGMDTVVAGRKQVDYLPFTIIGQAAVAMHARLTAGTAVSLQGVIEQREWTAEGSKKSKTQLKALRAEVILDDSARIVDSAGGQRLQEGRNVASVGGNLTDDVVVREVQVGGQPTLVADFRIGINKKFTDRKGTAKEAVTYTNVSAWGELAEQLRGLKKGDAVVVDGSVRHSSTEKNGVRYDEMKVVASSVQQIVKPSQSAAVAAPAVVAAAPAPVSAAPAAVAAAPVTALAPVAVTVEELPYDSEEDEELPF